MVTKKGSIILLFTVKSNLIKNLKRIINLKFCIKNNHFHFTSSGCTSTHKQFLIKSYKEAEGKIGIKLK